METKWFKLGKIFQQFILLEIFCYSHYRSECIGFLFCLNSSSRKYLKQNSKYLNYRLPPFCLIHEVKTSKLEISYLYKKFRNQSYQFNISFPNVKQLTQEKELISFLDHNPNFKLNKAIYQDDEGLRNLKLEII